MICIIPNVQNVDLLTAYSKSLVGAAPDIELYPVITRIPELKLMSAILYRAIKDLTNEERHIRRSARQFLNSSSKRIYGFIWICRALDLDPNYLRIYTYDQLTSLSYSLHGY